MVNLASTKTVGHSAKLKLVVMDAGLYTDSRGDVRLAATGAADQRDVLGIPGQTSLRRWLRPRVTAYLAIARRPRGLTTFLPGSPS